MYELVVVILDMFFFFQAEDGIRDLTVTGVQTCALPISVKCQRRSAPIAEEFFFRGFVFGALRRWHFTVLGRDLGTWAAAVVTGALFEIGRASCRERV